MNRSKWFYGAGSALFGACLAASTMVSAAVDPDHVEVTLEAGESTTINKHVTIPEDTTPDKVDVALLVDLSGSYSNDLPNIKSQIPEVFQDLVDAGIDSISVNPASFLAVNRNVHLAEVAIDNATGVR